MRKFELGGKCNNGHELTEKTLGTRKKSDGKYYHFCKVCKRNYERNYYEHTERFTLILGGRCREGHLLTEHTTYTIKGRLRCKICNSEKAAIYYQENRQAYTAVNRGLAAGIREARALPFLDNIVVSKPGRPAKARITF